MTSTPPNPDRAYLGHLMQYVGMGLISGSAVHAATLGGGWLRYTVLATLGVVLFSTKSLVDGSLATATGAWRTVGISALVGIGTGMFSGATQHYLDHPTNAAVLLGIGLLVGWLSFLWRDFPQTLGARTVAKSLIVSLLVFGITVAAAGWLSHHGATESSHHDRGSVRSTSHSMDEKDFLSQMVIHHEGALAMARIAVERSSDPGIVALSRGIIAAQQKEIAMMRSWQREADTGEDAGGMRQAMETMVQELDPYSDHAFLEGMIEHHEMAIDMARSALGSEVSEPVEQLAGRIIADQRAEIEVMRRTLNALSR